MNNQSPFYLIAKLLFAFCFVFSFAHANWEEIEKQARGQQVHWYAWGGSDLYNGYINWASEEVESRYGVKVEHIKLADTADAVRQVLAEKSTNATGSATGAIDVIWINGENFATMKKHNLLFGPFVDSLPNFALIDLNERPTVLSDFTVPTDGLEAPWGMAQLIFIHDLEYVKTPPQSPAELLAYAKANRGRITYPAPPDFLGTTFLKQLLLLLTPESERHVFYAPPNDNFHDATKVLWDYLDEIKPYLMRQGKTYPKSGQELLDLLDNRDIDMAFSFNVGAVSAGYADGNLSATARPYVWHGGSLANSHFLAIPFNAKSKAGAQVLINFLLSAEAQARKANPAFWGEPSVLSYHKLTPEDKKWFDALKQDERSLSVSQLGSALSEPHPEWANLIEAEWLKRLK